MSPEPHAMTQAVIVSAVRTPIGKAPNGALRFTRPDDMAAVVIKEALRRAPGLDPADVEDVIIGCAMPEAEQGLKCVSVITLAALIEALSSGGSGSSRISADQLTALRAYRDRYGVL